VRSIRTDLDSVGELALHMIELLPQAEPRALALGESDQGEQRHLDQAGQYPQIELDHRARLLR
jgi:hypothetical protein